MTKKVLVVGAGGFAGGFIVEEALRRGYEVWAGVRKSTSREYLTDERIHFIEFDFDGEDTIENSLKEALPESERWDYIVYNLGATKVMRYADFSRINYDYLRWFTAALKRANRVPEKFIYISSLSVMGRGDERRYTPFREDQVPIPNTRYGASKLKAEMWLAMENIPYVILRPTGIYGPHDKDYYLMFKSIARGFDFGAGYRKQQLTFLFVEDLANAVWDAAEKSATGKTYNLSEARSYTQREFRRFAKHSLKRRIVLPIRLPLWILRVVSFVSEKWGVAMMKPSTLNGDKYRIMKQRNWNVDITKACEGFGFSPRVSLEEGIEKSVRWYREAGWL